MAKTENSRRFAVERAADASPAPKPADISAAEPPESLDKVRDILFGGQMRAVEGRLHAVEERLLQEQAQLRADLGKQIAAIEAEARRELQALSEQLGAERAKRTEELKTLGADLRDGIRSLEKRHLKLEEMGGTADAELRDSILEQSRAVSAQIERLSQRVAADMSREVAGLRHDKADVSAVADVFSDMAGRLGNLLRNGPAPAGDGARS
jgi:DNA anti-recombination protein RmuC